MSESSLPTVAETALQPEFSSPASAGAMLRTAREAQGLHIAALAVALKIPVKKLEALEADEFHLLPGLVFVRALAASICRVLKIDPTLILEKLPQTTVTYLKTDDAGINTPFRLPGDGSGGSLLLQLSKPWVLAVVLLLLGVVVLLVFPLISRSGSANVPGSESATGVIAPPLGSALVGQVSGAAPELTANPLTAESSPGLSASESSVTVPGSGATTGLLVLKAHSVSWVKVVDADGVIQVSKNMAEGEVVGVSGVTPLSVVVGRSDTTEVQVRGKPLDLTDIAKSNVARFEVK